MNLLQFTVHSTCQTEQVQSYELYGITPSPLSWLLLHKDILDEETSHINRQALHCLFYLFFKNPYRILTHLTDEQC